MKENDTISRQAAIDTVEHITSSMSVCVNSDECHGMKRMQRQAIIELANLPSAQPEDKCSECDAWNKYKNYPSAQPEIIRCKDCTRYDKKCGCNLVEGLNVATAECFCSYAERREK